MVFVRHYIESCSEFIRNSLIFKITRSGKLEITCLHYWTISEFRVNTVILIALYIDYRIYLYGISHQGDLQDSKIKGR